MRLKDSAMPISSLTRRAFASLAPALVLKSAPVKRNILFIAIDDMNDWIGCLNGHPGTITPNLDRLASRGVNFTSAHCAAPLCNPARAALMTGRRPSSTGVYSNGQPYAGAKALSGVVTLNQHFKNSGYLTLGCGKIYHGTRGAFADMKGWHDYGDPKDTSKLPGKPPLAGAAAQGHFDWGPNTTGDEEMHDYQTTEWIGKHLQTKHDQPMFLACGFTRPHLPWYVPKKYFDMHPLDRVELPVVKEDDLDDVPEIGRRFARPQGDHARVTRANAWKQGVQAYLAAITFSDAMVGRVLRALETGPNANDTMVVLWSDHGWHLGEKLHWRKFTLWERSTRNILMFNIPGLTRPGARCDRTVSMMDIYPTLVELAGLKAPGVLEGESLTPWLRNSAAPKKTPAVTTYLFGNHAVRTDRWRYIRYKDGTEELYDRAKDPNEWTNLAGKAELAATKKELAVWLPKHNEPDAPGGRGADEA
jgi:arylsulfatase A-like enzyme